MADRQWVLATGDGSLHCQEKKLQGKLQGTRPKVKYQKEESRWLASRKYILARQTAHAPRYGSRRICVFFSFSFFFLLFFLSRLLLFISILFHSILLLLLGPALKNGSNTTDYLEYRLWWTHSVGIIYWCRMVQPRVQAEFRNHEPQHRAAEELHKEGQIHSNVRALQRLCFAWHSRMTPTITAHRWPTLFETQHKRKT